MPQCPTCGSAVTEGDAICPDCGMDLIEERHTDTPPAPVRLELIEASSASAEPSRAAAAPGALATVSEIADTPVEAEAEVGEDAQDAQVAGTAEVVEAGEAAGAGDGDEAEAPRGEVVEVAGAMAQEAASAEESAEPAPPADVPTARITLRRGGTTTSEVFALGSRAVLGRFDPETGPVDVDLAQLPEAVYVSRRHAEIWRDVTGTWLIKDLGSANGTFVREADATGFRKVGDEQPVADGYEIGLGNARFEFRVMH